MLNVISREYRFHNALIACHILSRCPVIVMETATALPDPVLESLEAGLRGMAEFLRVGNGHTFPGSAEMALAIEARLEDSAQRASIEHEPNASPLVKDRPPVRWTKNKRGAARVWTASWQGLKLRVERHKTKTAGVVFEAFINDESKLRSKSVVSARSRLEAMALRQLDGDLK